MQNTGIIGCIYARIFGGKEMIVYTVVMFVSGVVFLSFGIAIYKGNTMLIHDYH